MILNTIAVMAVLSGLMLTGGLVLDVLVRFPDRRN